MWRMARMERASKSVEGVDAVGPRLLRIEEIADRLAVSRSFAWKLVAQGDIRSLRRATPEAPGGYAWTTELSR
jgi:hypothetical protein